MIVHFANPDKVITACGMMIPRAKKSDQPAISRSRERFDKINIKSKCGACAERLNRM